MSNKQQLQTNNTALDTLITRVNAAKDVAASLPEAGGGSSGKTKLAEFAEGALSVITADDLRGATSIGNYAFYECDSLTSVEIGDSVTSIGDGAFSNCYSLTSVVISDSVTSIGAQAFYECWSLTSVTFNGTIARWNAIPKGQVWNSNVPATYVKCTDGQVAI